MFCPQCGKKVADGSKFCWNCGSEIILPQQTEVSAEPEKKEQPLHEGKPVKRTASIKKGAHSLLPRKINKKLLLIGGGLLAVVLAVVLIALLSAPKVVGEIPDPMHYFANFDVAVEDYTYFSSASLSIRMKEEGASSAALGYVSLLKSGGYPFILINEETSYGVTSYDFRYNGAEAYNNPSYIQLSVVINHWHGKVFLNFSDYRHFDFVSREQYGGEVYIPGLESFLTNAYPYTDMSGYIYYKSNDSSFDDADKASITSYADMLCDAYGFTLAEDLLEKGRWLLYGKTPDTFVDIYFTPQGIEFYYRDSIVLVHTDSFASAENSGKANAPVEEPSPAVTEEAPAVSLPDGPIVPDFSAFCNGNVSGPGITENRDHTKYTYTWNLNLKAQAEYIELLEEYGFVLRISVEGSNTDTYTFDYVGEGDVPTFDCSSHRSISQESRTGISILIWSCHYGGSTSEFQILVADGITYADTGDRTTRTITPSANATGSSSAGSSSDTSDGIPLPFPTNNPYGLQCITCNGSGDCQTCHGYGKVERYAGKGDTVTAVCPKCHGSGHCRSCGGTGNR